MTSIGVLIASPSAVFRTSLHSGMSGDDTLHVVGEADDRIGLLLFAVALHPDIVLLDEDIDTKTDPPVLPQLQTVSPDTRTLLFAEVVNSRLVMIAIDQGARGCLPKNAPPEQWLRAIRSVQHGDIWINRRLLTEALVNLLHKHVIQRRDGSVGPRQIILTPRQREIVHCAARGLSNKQIARQMGISPTTVKTHLQHIFTRLHVSGRVQLIARSVDTQLH